MTTRMQYIKKWSAIAVIALLLGLLAACGGTNNDANANTGANEKHSAGETSGETAQTTQTPEKPVTLTVSAAASLGDSLEELEPAFEQSHPDIKLQFNLGASGSLQKQIEQGAPADLFLSAGQKQMDALIQAGLVEAEQSVPLLQNRLVLIVPTDAQLIPKSLDDLKQAAVHQIAVGDPDVVPAGQYTKQALDHEKLWDSLQSKMVLAKDVTQVLTYVETGNVDAGFVYLSDAQGSTKVKVELEVDEATHDPIIYPGGIIAATPYPEQAKVFLDYLQRQEARDVFQKHGFTGV